MADISPAKATAMILAAGRGKRMQAYASDIPKPLVKIGGKSLIDYAIGLLNHAGIAQAVVNTHHLAEQISRHLAAVQHPQITLSHEEELLETGGGVVKALPLLDEQFFTLNSDVICVEKPGQSVLRRMAQHWDAERMDNLMLLCPLERAIGYDGKGDFCLAEDGRILPFQEGHPAYVYMGIQHLHRRWLKDAPPQGAFSFSPLYKAEVARGDQCRLFGLVHEGAWLHVGDPQGVALAEEYLAETAIA